MSERAQKAENQKRSSDTAASAASRSTRSPALEQSSEVTDQDAPQAVAEQTPRFQALAQLKQSISGSPRVVQLEQLRQSLAQSPRTQKFAQLKNAIAQSPRVVQLEQLRQSLAQSPRTQKFAQLKNAIAQSPRVVQRIVTRAESAAGDIMHRDRANIFNDGTLDAYEAIRTHWYATPAAKAAALTEAIEDDRQLDYKVMSADEMDTYNDALALAGDRREHMYVHDGDTIHRGDRNHEKLPHPALVGGDPDVSSAGTLRATYNAGDGRRLRPTLRVKVTNESGHFRPTNVPEATRAAVEEKAQTNQPARTRVFVDIVDR